RASCAHAGRTRSRTVARRPASLKATAHASPAMPPPAMTTSARTRGSVEIEDFAQERLAPGPVVAVPGFAVAAHRVLLAALAAPVIAYRLGLALRLGQHAIELAAVEPHAAAPGAIVDLDA